MAAEQTKIGENLPGQSKLSLKNSGETETVTEKAILIGGQGSDGQSQLRRKRGRPRKLLPGSEQSATAKESGRRRKIRSGSDSSNMSSLEVIPKKKERGKPPLIEQSSDFAKNPPRNLSMKEELLPHKKRGKPQAEISEGSSFAHPSLACPDVHASAWPSRTDNMYTSVSNQRACKKHVSGADSYMKFVVANYQRAIEAHNKPSNVTTNANKETSATINRQSRACPGRSTSLNLTRMCLMDDDVAAADINEADSRPDNGLVFEHGYRVKAEFAPVLRHIISTYGDIAQDCIFSVKYRYSFLEDVCGIYKKLEGSSFMLITSKVLKWLLGEVREIEKVNIEVGWLRNRLNEILEAKTDLRSLKEEKDILTRTTETRRQEVETLTKKLHEKEKDLADEEAKKVKINEKLVNLTSTEGIFPKKSLVDGLLRPATSI